MVLLLTPTLLFAPAAEATGLVQFPCTKPLGNTYHLMRAGQTLLEEQDIWSTNPLFLTNREAALSELGQQQVQEASRRFRAQFPTAVRYSLAASAMDSANIMGRELNLGRDRLVPEFNFMDPRAVGKYDMMPLSSTEPAVWAMDSDEAGSLGLGGRPPPNEDSTPHETLADQAVRLRQLLSVLETQYSGDTVLLIFPDGTGPALLSAMIAGIPYNRAHELEFSPGELRLDVTMSSTLALWKERQRAAEQQATLFRDKLATGRQELQRLRAMAPEDLISVKDQQLERERLEQEALAARREEMRLQKEERDRLAREERARQIQDIRERQREGGEGDWTGRTVPVTAGLGAAGVLALTSLPRTGKDEQMEIMAQEAVKPAVNATNTSASTSFPLDDDDAAAFEEMMAAAPLIAEDADGLAAAVVVSSRVNGDRQATFVKPVISKKLAAEEAMREYMEQDDGGQEWLQMMVDLANEEDESEGIQR